MRIATWNVNGLRSAVKDGLCDAVLERAPDVLLLQELKCTREVAERVLRPLSDSYQLTDQPSA